MKILILGGTGQTGQEVIKQALADGHRIKVLARNLDKLSYLARENTAEVVHGSVYEAADMRKAMAECDAVISALGGKPGMNTPCDIYSKTIDVIVEVMTELNVKRLVTLAAWGTKDDPRLGFLFRRVFKPTLLRNVNADMGVMEDKLEASGPHIVWTVVKPPMLNNNPLSGLPIQAAEGHFCPGPGKEKLCRADLAKFMLSCLDTPEWERKLVAVKGGHPQK